MATIFRGLNVNRFLNDVDDKDEALQNLGINIEDLDAIRGISDVVSAIELRLLAGLQNDQRKEFVSLAESAKEVGGRLESLQDFRNPFDFNLTIDNKLSGSAIKYNYLDLSDFSDIQQKSADISTSRISSWSSTEPGKIFYGGELLVTGDKIELGSFRLTQAPIQKTFRAEVATHQIALKFTASGGGTTQRTAYAMKGIPLQFDTFFKDADFRSAVRTTDPALTDGLGTIPATWRVINEDNGFAYNSGDGTIKTPIGIGTVETPGVYEFRDPGAKARKVEFFYPPDRILRLDITGVNLGDWPSVSLTQLEYLDISLNDFFEMPKFGQGTSAYGSITTNVALAPALKTLILTGNNMSRAQDSNGNQIKANVQLQYLPTSLTTLTMNGTFSDDEVIDIRYLTNLTTISMDTFYTRDAARAMTGSTDTDPANSASPKDGTSPRVHTGIVSYNVTRQPYSRLADGVCDSTSLNTLNITLCDITRRETARNNAGDAVPEPSARIQQAIQIASPNIDYFYSYSNSHNIVNFNSNESIFYYWHRYSRSLPSFLDSESAALAAADIPAGETVGEGRTLNSKIQGCSNLYYMNFYATDCEDDIENTFSNLGSLYRFDTRWSRMYGRFSSDSFVGTPNMGVFLVSGSLHGDPASAGDPSKPNPDLARDDFFSVNTGLPDAGTVFEKTPNFGYLYCYNNINIGGDLPDLSTNTNLRVIYIRNTSFGTRLNDVPSAPLPSFAANFRLYYLRADYNKFTGAVPSFASNGLYYLFLAGNRFTSLPAFSGTNIRYVYLQQNDIGGDGSKTGVSPTGAIIPTYDQCPRLLRLYLNQNEFTGYTAGAIASNLIIQTIDFSNNNLTASDGVNIINDLAANYNANPRGGVSVNLINQNGLTESAILSDQSAGPNLSFLRSVGWSIQLSP